MSGPRHLRLTTLAVAMCAAALTAGCAPAPIAPPDRPIRWTEPDRTSVPTGLDRAMATIVGFPDGGVAVSGVVADHGEPGTTFQADPSIAVWNIDGTQRWRTTLTGRKPATALVARQGGALLAARAISADTVEVTSFDALGTPAAGFATNGTAQIPVPPVTTDPGDTPYATVSAMTLDVHGRIVLAVLTGGCDNQLYPCRYSDGAVHLVRLLGDGTVDPSFHGGAPLQVSPTGYSVYDLRSKLVTWPDASIGVATGIGDDAVSKVLPDGSGLDPSYGNGGIAEVQPDAPALCATGDQVAVLDLGADGSVLAVFEGRPLASSSNPPPPECEWRATHLSPTGQVDSTFGGDGHLELPRWFGELAPRSSSDGDSGFSMLVPREAIDAALGSSPEGLRMMLRSYSPDGQIRSDHQLPAYFPSAVNPPGSTMGATASVVDGKGNRYVVSGSGDSPYVGLIALG